MMADLRPLPQIRQLASRHARLDGWPDGSIIEIPSRRTSVKV
jgi:hypothetical protein